MIDDPQVVRLMLEAAELRETNRRLIAHSNATFASRDTARGVAERMWRNSSRVGQGRREVDEIALRALCDLLGVETSG